MMRYLRVSLVLVVLLMVVLVVGVSAETSSSWKAQYWNNTSFRGSPVVERQEQDIFYTWGRTSPVPGRVNQDLFSVRWSRTVNFTAGTYEFKARADDLMRIKVDGKIIVDMWYPDRNHTFLDRTQQTTTGQAYITAGDHDIVVEYVELGDQATAQVTWDKVLSATTGGNGAQPAPQTTPWTGVYFNNSNLRGNAAFVRQDAEIDFDWGTGSPADGWRTDAFSVRWTNNLDLNPGRYRFTVVVDDGARLSVNNRRVIDSWADEIVRTISADVTIRDGKAPVTLEYREGQGKAQVRLSWVLLYPLGSNAAATTPNPTAQTATSPTTPVAATATMKARTPVRQTFSDNAPPLTFAEINETVTLASTRSADSQWVRIITEKNVWGWVRVSQITTNYPIESLDPWRTDW